jgi:hypothetical protein
MAYQRVADGVLGLCAALFAKYSSPRSRGVALGQSENRQPDWHRQYVTRMTRWRDAGASLFKDRCVRLRL